MMCLIQPLILQDHPLALVIVLTVPLKLAFTISAHVNGGMSDWFIPAQIWIVDIAVN